MVTCLLVSRACERGDRVFPIHVQQLFTRPWPWKRLGHGMLGAHLKQSRRKDFSNRCVWSSSAAARKALLEPVLAGEGMEARA